MSEAGDAILDGEASDDENRGGRGAGKGEGKRGRTASSSTHSLDSSSPTKRSGKGLRWQRKSLSPSGSGKQQQQQQDIFCLTPDSELYEEDNKVCTSNAPLTHKEQQALDELAKLFTIQEEKCLREHSTLSKGSIDPSTTSLDATFIYQHVNFQVLARCVPGFVKSHLNRSCRYLPETFILRVNYWRRRRALGDDSKVKAKESAARACLEQKDKDKDQQPRPRAGELRRGEPTRRPGGAAGAGDSGGDVSGLAVDLGSGGGGSVMTTPRTALMTSSRSPRAPPTVIITQ